MRKIWILAMSFVVVAVSVAVCFWAIRSAEPKLRVEFNDPWHTRPGETFELDVKIVNDAQESDAKNVQIHVSAPENFTVSRTGTSECSLNFGVLRGGEAVNDTLFLAVPFDASLGDYTITVRVWAENVPEQTFTPHVIVELPLS